MTHSHDTESEWRGTGDERAYFSRAVCECGWQGPERSAPTTYKAERRDYREHVIAVLGEDMAYYEAPVHCVNCDYRGPASLLVGTDVFAGTCGMCGASGRLRPDNDRWHEETERTKDWFR